MRRPGYLKLPCVAALISVIVFCPMRNIGALPMNATPVCFQAPEGSSDQLDTILAKYYEHYAGRDSFEERIRQATEANGTKPKQIEIVKTVEGGGFPAGIGPSALPAGSLPQVWGQVANSNLIVIGTPVKARTLPIANRTFAFTQYAVHVEKVISSGQTHVLAEDTIIVSRGGGELMVDNVLIKAVESAFSEFELNQSYVLMLRVIPGTTTYRALASGTYAVRNGQVFSASTFEKDITPKWDINRFLAEIDAALGHKSPGGN